MDAGDLDVSESHSHLGPRRIAAFLGLAASTVCAVLRRHGRAWRERLAAEGIEHRFIRPYRPQTNGKVERFNRTLLEEWAYAAVFHSSHERAEVLPGWLHTYNHHRSHTALDGHPPITRVNDLCGPYT